MRVASADTVDTLQQTLVASFSRRFDAFLAQADALTADLSDTELWARPYPYGNSVGHLLLHITGNLNYYIGTQIAGTGYVRDRPREFGETHGPSRAVVLQALAEAVEMVKATIGAQTPESWSAPYDAVGSDETTRFGIVLRCTHHFHHHLGQIIYLVREHARQRGEA